MALSLAPEHLARYKEIGKLFWKYGRGDLIPPDGFGDAITQEERDSTAPISPKAEELAADLERLGPVYVKLGQVLSSRGDILPAEYVKALSRLQDSLEPFPFEQVEEIVQEELGVRISKAFSEFDPKPIGIASLGQVHRARLREGREVAVKVQRPGIKEQIKTDMEALAEIAEFVDNHTELGRRYRVGDILDQFRRNLVLELDYRQEARNLEQIAENLREFERILIPLPVNDFTTARVLTMDYIRGRKITELGPLSRIEMDGGAIADELFQAYLKQILLDGLFHADPHPGNILLTPDHQLALIDLGMIGRLAPGMQEHLLKLLIAIGEGRSEDAVDVAIKIGEPLEDFNETAFQRKVADLIAQNQSSTVESIQIGRALIEFSRVSGNNGIRMPPELTMLGKALLNLDEIGRSIDPDFHPTEAIRRHSAGVTRRRMMKSLSPGNIFSAAMEAKELAQEMPARVNRILDLISRNQLRLSVETIDEQTLIEGFQKVANRIATALVLAALIIGAALLMQVQTSFRLFGYPGLAMICFLAAATGGFYLVLTILLGDRHQKQSKSKSDSKK